jgi:hypothetical protein
MKSKRRQARAGAEAADALARVAVEDELDRAWEEGAADALVRVRREWAGEPDDWPGQLQALAGTLPPQPLAFRSAVTAATDAGRWRILAMITTPLTARVATDGSNPSVQTRTVPFARSGLSDHGERLLASFSRLARLNSYNLRSTILDAKWEYRTRTAQ